MSQQSPRHNHRAKVARENGLWCRSLLCANGLETPIVTAEQMSEAVRRQIDGSAAVKWQVPCREGDPGAGLDLNTAENILRGMSSVESALAYRKAVL